MTGKQLVALKDRIVKSFTTSDWTVVGTLLDADDAVHGRERLLRSQRFGDDDYDSEALIAIKKMIDANPNNLAELLEYLDAHYPTNDVAQGDFVSSGDDGGRRIAFSPLVFKVPSKLPDPNLISVMMPFGAATKPTYEAVQAAALDAGFSCKRADNIWEAPTVIQDVFSLIYESFIVVCDFSGKNANVFYEAGIAHTLGKHVVGITQSIDDIPFDIRHHRHATYLDNMEGRTKLTREIKERFITLRNQRDTGNVQ